MTDAALCALEDRACPAPARAADSSPPTPWRRRCEFLGLAEMGSGDVPADRSDASTRSRARTGALVMDVLRAGRRPRRSSRAQALENAIASVAATGGSTNAVLHLVAIAREAGVPLGSTTSIASTRACRSSPI